MNKAEKTKREYFAELSKNYKKRKEYECELNNAITMVHKTFAVLDKLLNDYYKLFPERKKQK